MMPARGYGISQLQDATRQYSPGAAIATDMKVVTLATAIMADSALRRILIHVLPRPKRSPHWQTWHLISS